MEGMNDDEKDDSKDDLDDENYVEPGYLAQNTVSSTIDSERPIRNRRPP
jgi:hypothetical protein